MSAEGVTFIVAATLSLVCSLVLGLWLSPDVAFYTGGVGLFPSPLGTLIGAAGVEVLAIVHALAVGAVFAGLVLLRPPLYVVALATPSLLWLAWLGVDAIAAVLFAWGYLRGRSLGLVLAVGVHLAALPLALGAVRRRGLVLAVAAFGAAVLVLTPYGVGLTVSLDELATGAAFAACITGVALLPAVAGRVVRGRVLWLAAGTFAAITYAGAWDAHRGVYLGNIVGGTLRYALPLALVSLALSARRVSDGRAERPTTAPGSERDMRKFSLSVAVVALVALLVVPAAFAQTVPAVPVGEYGDSLLASLATAIGAIFPYAAAITAFAIAVGMVKRWLGHRKATRV